VSLGGRVVPLLTLPQWRRVRLCLNLRQTWDSLSMTYSALVIPLQLRVGRGRVDALSELSLSDQNRSWDLTIV
jgi:hypothetical protein